MDTLGIEQMLSALRTTAAQASGKTAENSAPAAGGADFAQILQGSIDKVNQTQVEANQMAEKLAAGDTNQNLHEVMIALQTASVSLVAAAIRVPRCPCESWVRERAGATSHSATTDR